MLFGCFCFSLFTGGEEVDFINILEYLNKCPNCKQGGIFKGLIKLRNYCSNCNIKLDSEKIGDGASWITTSLICFFFVPILFIFEINIGISYKVYIVIVLPLLIFLSIILLRIFKFLLLKKYYEVT